MTTNRTFKTSDMTLAAFLLCRGCELAGVDDSDPARVAFLLHPMPTAETLADFQDESAYNANVQTFAKCWRKVKRVAFGREAV